jgi:hypothetical protein
METRRCSLNSTGWTAQWRDSASPTPGWAVWPHSPQRVDRISSRVASPWTTSRSTRQSTPSRSPRSLCADLRISGRTLPARSWWTTTPTNGRSCGGSGSMGKAGCLSRAMNARTASRSWRRNTPSIGRRHPRALWWRWTLRTGACGPEAEGRSAPDHPQVTPGRPRAIACSG